MTRGRAGSAFAAALVVAAIALAAGSASAKTDPRVGEAVTLEARASALVGNGKYAAADTLYQQALALRQATPAREDDAIALAGLAEARRNRRRFADVDSLTQLALDLLATAKPRDLKLESRVHEVRANAFAERRDTERALPEIDRAIAMQDSIAPADSIAYARQLANRARIISLEGRSAESIVQFQIAAGIQERQLGPVSADLGDTMFRMAQSASEVGDYVLGARAAERAIAIREQVFGPDHVFVAIASMGVGSARRDLGDNAGAIAAFERAERILRAMRPPSPGTLATVVSNKGSVYLVLGDGAKARACYEETIAIRDSLFGPGRGEDLFAAGRVSYAMMLEGHAAEARARLEKALAKATRVDPLVTPGTLAIHGSIAYRLGDCAAARASLERSYTISDSLRGPGSPRTLETLGQLAALDLAEGRRADAFRRASEIEERGRTFLAQAADMLSEREALDWSGIRETGLTVMIALAADSIGLDAPQRRAVLDAVIRSRMLVLDRRAEERRAVPADDPALRPLVAELDAARADLARLLVAVAHEEDADSAAIEAARGRRERAERALGEASASYGGAKARVDGGVAEVASGLSRGWALVSFVRMTPPVVEIVDVTARDPKRSRYTAFVLRPGEEAPRVVSLGPASGVENAIDRWVEALATRPSAETAAAAERRAATLGRGVRRAMWEPLQRALAGADTIAWVPDGALHRMDLAALPGEASGKYLVDDRRLYVRLTAERDLVPEPDAARRPHETGLLALGAVDFDAAPGPEPSSSPSPSAASTTIVADASIDRGGSRLRFAPLPATAQEIESIARTWNAAEPNEPARVHVGADAREDLFKREAPGARVLHLATHAFALGGSIDPAAFVADAGERGVGGVAPSSSTGGEGVPRKAPVVPGLALAGANRPAAVRGEDGFLTAEELSSLDLSGVEWTVLSACETGAADPDAVEAVQGLHRAFRRAGVETVIMSLWSVDDAATAAWMEALYRAHLVDGLATATAVRAAQRSVLAARRKAGESTHPFWWAAFVASGRGR